jgi:hypothetical protein
MDFNKHSDCFNGLYNYVKWIANGWDCSLFVIVVELNIFRRIIDVLFEKTI